MDRPLRLLIDARRCTSQMREALVTPELEVVTDAATADVIVFNDDTPQHVRSSTYYRQFPRKCIVVSGVDVPSYYLPALYASRHRHPFALGRTGSCDYFMDEANPFIPEFSEAGLPKKWLLSFVGGSTSWARKRLFRVRDTLAAPDVLIQSTDSYEHWTNDDAYLPTKRARQREYAEVMAQSSFVLCPRGAGRASIRLFEVMQMGVCPIIVADGWVRPEGPDWPSFALFLPEKRIGSCVELAQAHARSAEAMGRKARQEWESYFSPQMRGLRLRERITQLLASRKEGRERLIHRVYFFKTGFDSLRGATQRWGKKAVLGVYKLLGRKFPYQLNRPS